jgi:hypothetical protein
MQYKGKLMALSVCVRAEPLTFISRSRGTEFTDGRLNSHAMLGILPATTIKGWLRAGMNRFLMENGISGMHPLPENTISQNNKQRYQSDLASGYLPRDVVGTDDHVISQLFGTLGRLGNLRVSNVYFYPREANGKFKNLQTVFNGRIGYGRVDIHRNSPTEQVTGVEKYMTSEFLEFHAVEAPLVMGLFRDDPVHEAFVAVVIEYINQNNAACDPRFLMGGQRGFGAGEVVIRLVDNFKAPFNTTGLTKEKFTLYQKIIDEKLVEWREKFPIERTLAANNDNEKGVAIKANTRSKKKNNKKKAK